MIPIEKQKDPSIMKGLSMKKKLLFTG